VVELDPAYPNAYNDPGAYLVELGRPREAEPWLRRAMEMPDYCCPHFPHYQMGRALLIEGRVAAANRSLERAPGIHPGYRPAIDLLCEIRRRGLRGT
jgi:Tfp pilus assembly protein PilF